MSVGFSKRKRTGPSSDLFYPVNTNLVILGKGVPYYIINVFQFILMMLVGVYVMSHIISFSFNLSVIAGTWCLLPSLIAAATTGYGVLVAAFCENHRAGFNPCGDRGRPDGCFWRDHDAAHSHAADDEETGDDFTDALGTPGLPGYFSRGRASFGDILPRLIILTVFAGICFYITGRRVKWI